MPCMFGVRADVAVRVRVTAYLLECWIDFWGRSFMLGVSQSRYVQSNSVRVGARVRVSIGC